MMERFYTQLKSTLSKSSVRKVYIIGKGPSVYEVDTSQLLSRDSVVINLNDSEKILPGDFAILHRAWAYQSVRECGFKAACYISDIPITSATYIPAKYYPSTYDSFENVVNLLLKEELFVSDFLFLSALKLSMIISNLFKTAIKVYFLGFDFVELPQSKNSEVSSVSIELESTEHSLLLDDLKFKNSFLKRQEAYFLYLKKMIKDIAPGIEMIHVGMKSYSTCTPQDFNTSGDSVSYLDVPSNFNTKQYSNLCEKVESGHVAVVAEFTNNHIGDKNRLREMIKLAVAAGADLIKVQKRDVETFYTQRELRQPYASPFGKTLGDYRRGVEMDEEMFELLIIECFKYKIPWFVSVLDYPSFEFIRQFDVPLIKIPSTISEHRNFIKNFSSSYANDVVVSTGFTNANYEKFILDTFASEYRRLWLLQCASSYPAPLEACQIAVVRHYAKMQATLNLSLYPGYSSHDVGSIVSMMAVAAGAKMIEKHVKLGDLDWVHFDGVAVDLRQGEFQKFISDIRKAEIICGDEIKTIHSVEHHKYKPNDMHN